MSAPRVLLTGSSGWLGGWLARDLAAAGWAVVGLSRRANRPGDLAGDLLAPEGFAAALAGHGPFAAVVHAAVQPHRFTDTLRGRRETSPALAAGLVAAWRVAFGAAGLVSTPAILLSTVSVYGEADRDGPIGPDAELRPPTAYGKGKLEAEALWQSAGWGRATILRVGPVYSAGRTRNAAVRSYLPGTRLRVHLNPPPRFSLCAIERLGERLRARLAQGLDAPGGPENVVDPEPWTAPAVDAAFGFTGPRITVSAALPQAILRALRHLPGTYGLRCLLTKRVGEVVYR